MKSIKQLISVMFIAALMVCVCACSGSTGTEESSNNEKPSEPVSGGWAINEEGSAELPEEVKKAFDSVTSELMGTELEPVAYVGSQVVAGMNYMVLCRATTVTENPVTNYQMLVMYVDLEGKAKLNALTDFDVTKYIEGEGTLNTEVMTGGWYVPDDACGSDIPDEVSAAFDKAASQAAWSWSKIAPLAYLSSQVVAGTNYALLYKAEAPNDAPATIVVVTVYEDLEGNAEITNTCGLDLAEFNE